MSEECFFWNEAEPGQQAVDFVECKINLKRRFRDGLITADRLDRDHQVAEVMIGVCNRVIDGGSVEHHEYWGFKCWMEAQQLLALRTTEATLSR